jgi:NO-binding membrane sensor protein with MHYT domain
MGGGIWSMHFIGMLAFIMPMPVGYDLGLTLLSLVVAIGVTGFGFFMIGTRQVTALEFVLSAIFMGIGIVAMHYIGMAAMRMPADIPMTASWSPCLFLSRSGRLSLPYGWRSGPP